MELNAKTIMNRLQKETELLKPMTPENSKKCSCRNAFRPSAGLHGQ